MTKMYLVFSQPACFQKDMVRTSFSGGQNIPSLTVRDAEQKECQRLFQTLGISFPLLSVFVFIDFFFVFTVVKMEFINSLCSAKG